MGVLWASENEVANTLFSPNLLQGNPVLQYWLILGLVITIVGVFLLTDIARRTVGQIVNEAKVIENLD